MEQQMQQSDHDLLVTLVAKVDAFISGQVASQNDHEARIRVLESTTITTQGMSLGAKSILGGAIAIIGIAEPLFLFWMANK